MTTSLKFLAAPRMRAMPPMSIFSTMSASEAPLATVASKGYKSTTTKSMLGRLYSAIWAWSPSWFRRLRMPPNTLG